MAKANLVSVGCTAIDLQHRLLMQLLVDVVDGVREGSPHQAFLASVEKFRLALASHFRIEQDMLEESGFKGAADHAGKHAEIISRLEAAATALRHVTSAAARFAIVNEMEDALYLHEVLDDAEYAGHVSDIVPNADWDDSLKIGVDWVDAEHRQLFAILKVFSHHARREEWEMCRFVLGRLLDRVKAHFDNEDAYLRTLGASSFDHRRHHLEALLSIEDLLVRSDRSAFKDVAGFMVQVLRDHILEQDRRDLAPEGVQ